MTNPSTCINMYILRNTKYSLMIKMGGLNNNAIKYVSFTKTVGGEITC